ncbi:MAG: tail fiber domain-containing protein, partial [Phaeodactylibacter sp.]|nr:tail fiber domain-containing protein [Phaeodactylibacter sp.]
NGMVILAGRNSVGLNSTESSFLQFIRPDGSSGLFTVGKIKQNGDLTIAYNTASDMRLKTNIKPSTKGLNDLLKIQVADYNYIDDRPTDRRQGFLAQQLYQHFPYAVDEGGADPKDEPWMIDYGLLTPLLVQAIQDRQAIIDAHQAKIEQQQTRIETLQSEMQELDALKEKLAKLQTAIQSSPSPSTSK